MGGGDVTRELGTGTGVVGSLCDPFAFGPHLTLTFGLRLDWSPPGQVWLGIPLFFSRSLFVVPQLCIIDPPLLHSFIGGWALAGRCLPFSSFQGFPSLINLARRVRGRLAATNNTVDFCEKGGSQHLNPNPASAGTHNTTLWGPNTVNSSFTSPSLS